MSGVVYVRPESLAARAAELDRMAGELAAIVPRIALYAANARLHELVGYGILAALPVAADLFSMCLPGTAGSLPDAAAELAAMAVAVRAAEAAYTAVDTLGWARSELPTAEALVMLAAWRQLHLVVRVTDSTGVPFVGPVVDRVGEDALEQADRWIEGAAVLRRVDPTTMPPLPSDPAAGLDRLLTVVDVVSDARHPSTVAVLHVGDEPPRYVLCLPGLQDATGADAGAADLPGALATLAGHSAYIRGMRELLHRLPAGSQVLLVGHSQGGMVAEALAEHAQVGGVTIAGLLTAGSPTLADRVDPAVPRLVLRNTEDPVPKLGRAAQGGLLPTDEGPVVRFSTPGLWVSGAKHGLGSGGYVAEAGSDDPRVAAFRHRMAAFLPKGRVDTQFLQVTDGDGPAGGLPR